MSKSKVLVLMTGSIACYKAAQVVSRLTQRRCEVQVVASPSALQFIGNATIEGLSGRPLITDMYGKGNMMDHIHLVRWADVILVAPATANFINKAAQGVGDDLLTTMFLAHDFKKPFLIAPAMNTSMYLHPVTQKSIHALRDMGIEILETGSGVLACGEEGQGRLLEPDLIAEAVMTSLRQSAIAPETTNEIKTQAPGKRAKVLITSGGTQEPIDTVRVISNLSSGRTGRLMAEQLESLGIDVHWLRAHGSQDSQWVSHKSVFTDFKSLQSQIQELLGTGLFTHIIHLAAVSDYSVKTIQVGDHAYKPLDLPKIKSEAEEIQITLAKNPKIVNHLHEYSSNKDLKVIAFKLTSQATTEEQQQAVTKLQKEAHASFVVHNDLSEINIKTHKHPFNIYFNERVIRCEDTDELVRHIGSFIIEEAL